MAEKSKRSPLTVGILSVAGAAYLGFSSYAVLALFTDTEQVTANAFTAGTIDLATDSTTGLLTFSDMAPGDATSGGITVTNSGTLELRYAVTSTTTEDTLAGQIDLTLRVEAALGDCTTTSTGTPVLYNIADLGSTAGINLVGSPATGAQAGDRTLAPGATEVLCFQASLPLSTDNTFQGLNTTATVTFAAEQTANNP